MNVLITAGGTSEKIDEVRKITNTATGKLGALIAEEFSGYINVNITYIHGNGAIIPRVKKIKAIEITNAGELNETAEKLLKYEKFDAVIHSMAVSDYSVKSVLPLEEVVSSIMETSNEKPREEITTAVKDIFLKRKNIGEGSKISSNYDNLIMVLEKTPKIINLFKKIQPDTILVGFKLLTGTDKETLLNIGYNLLLKNKCDFVFANDLKHINIENHSGILIKPDRSFTEISSKEKIAKVIAENVIYALKKKDMN